MESIEWRKASRSNANGENCVELARVPSAVAARDSKNPDGPFHKFSAVVMADLFEEIRRGRYDLT
ncbi:DUF397 domain-containing protein [Spirillospora sp. CA-108201]